MLDNMKQVAVRIFIKEIRILILGLILMAPLLNYGQVTFTEVPLDKQLYARDSNDKGHVIFDGTISDADAEFDTYTSIQFDIRRVDEFGNETFYKSVSQEIGVNKPIPPYTNNTTSFNFDITIDARLSSFNFQMFGVIGNVTKLLVEVDDIVAGDVYVIQGQSNAEALVQTGEPISVVPFENDFIRVFGSSNKNSVNYTNPNDDSHRIWYYGKGDKTSQGRPAGIGQWGIIFANSIVINENIPVAIFNAATGGKQIAYFDKYYNNSVESETGVNSYERLVWRLDQTRLKDKVKAVIWSQGEADATLQTTTQEYMTMFQALLDDWNTDFSGLLSKFYIFQTKSACGDKNSMKVKEAQRRLADGSIIKIIQTAGLSYINDCHFSVTDGYEKFASRIYSHISADFYGGTDNESIYTPTLVRSYLRGPTTLVLETMASEIMASILTNNSIDLADFELNSSNSVSITNISIEPEKKSNIIFELSGNPSGTVTITYLGRGFGVSNNTNNLIVNGGGIELVCFNEYPVDTSLKTIWNGTQWSLADPIETLDAEIDGNYDISRGSIVARDLQINSGEIISFDSGAGVGNDSIVLYGDLIINTNASLTIGDTESFIMRNTNALVDLKGNATFSKKEKSTELKTKYDVTYWGSSVEGETLGSVFPNVDANRIFEYKPLEENINYTGAYEKYKHWFIASGNMTPGKGYSVDGDSEPGNPVYPRFSEVEFEGIPNYKDISVQINKFSSGILTYDQSNLLANPYPAAIDPVALIDENSDIFKGTIYIWTHSSEYISGEYEYDYLTYNKSGSGSSHIPGDYHIASGQGFMILTDETSATFNFRNFMMVAGDNNNFYKSNTKKNDDNSKKNRVWINLSGEDDQFKEILVAFFENTTDGLDIGYDGQLLNTEAALTFYSLINEDKYAIQALNKVKRKQNRGLSLGFSASKMGNYSIGLSRFEGELSNQNIYLVDKQLHLVHNLRKQDYNFNLNSTGEYNNRFSLLFEEISLDHDSLIEEIKIIVSFSNDELILESEKKVESVRIHDYLGRLLTQGKPVNNVLAIKNVGIPKESVLFMQIVFGDGSIYKKKIVRMN